MAKKLQLLETLDFLNMIGADEAIADHPVVKVNATQKKFKTKEHITPSAPSGPPLSKKFILQSPIEAVSKAKESARKARTLEELKTALENFEGCALKQTAMHTVFSDGQPDAKIMIVGEAPGADEDRMGRPFVGLSGQLLDRLLATIGLDRKKNIYISNIVPWRPPGNRQPSTAETNVCLPFIIRHIELVAPKILLLVGGTAAKALLQSQEGIMKLRGKWIPYQTENSHFTTQAFATFHPAFLLRSPGQKRYVWLDLLKLQRALEEFSIQL